MINKDERLKEIMEISEILQNRNNRITGDDISLEEKEKITRALITVIENKVIPNEFPSFMLNNMAFFSIRDVVIKEQGFALICKKWITPLAKWINGRRCLEVMAGCGSLTYALQEEGVCIKATDNYSWNGMASWNVEKKYYTNVENLDCVEAIKKYGKNIDIIIISWAYMDNQAYKCLLEMRKVNPNAVMIVIGEGHGGCTADDDFFENIILIEDEEFDKVASLYDTWYGLYDTLTLVK